MTKQASPVFLATSETLPNIFQGSACVPYDIREFLDAANSYPQSIKLLTGRVIKSPGMTGNLSCAPAAA